MDASRGALAIAEPGSPGGVGGEVLNEASDAIYYRTKAAYVLWMLRDMVGETTLSAALRGYKPEDDLIPEYFERLLEQTTGKHDLQWFFDDWVYRDQGLADLVDCGSVPQQELGGGIVAGGGGDCERWVCAGVCAGDGALAGDAGYESDFASGACAYYASDCDRGCSGGSGGE